MEGTGDAPRVSVVVPAYDAEPFIADTLRSILGQTFRDLEVLLVDDGSTDGTAEVVAGFAADPRLRVLRKANGGTVSDARNHGLDHARGELVAFLDADDVWHPEKLAAQVAALDADPRLGMVHCAYAIADGGLHPQTIVVPAPGPATFARWLLLEGNGIAPSSTMLVRRALVEQAGRFRLELSVSEDLDYAERLSRLAPVGTVADCLALYRTHPGQGHNKLDRYEHDMEWIFADRFGVDGSKDRRRWSRGRANLHTRLLFYAVRGGRWRDASRHLAVVVARGPHRAVVLPLGALARRRARRQATRVLGPRARQVEQLVVHGWPEGPPVASGG